MVGGGGVPLDLAVPAMALREGTGGIGECADFAEPTVQLPCPLLDSCCYRPADKPLVARSPALLRPPLFASSHLILSLRGSLYTTVKRGFYSSARLTAVAQAQKSLTPTTVNRQNDTEIPTINGTPDAIVRQSLQNVYRRCKPPVLRAGAASDGSGSSSGITTRTLGPLWRTRTVLEGRHSD